MGTERFREIGDTSLVWIRSSLGSVMAPDNLLRLLEVTARVGLDRSTLVEDADDVSVDPNADELPSEGPPHPVPGTGEEDPAVAIHLAQVAVGMASPITSGVSSGSRRIGSGFFAVRSRNRSAGVRSPRD